MARLGVETIVAAIRGGDVPTGYTDTGVTLITANPVEGIDSEGVVVGYEGCWGESDPDVLAMAMELEGSMMGDEEIIIGLITKTETNPFFVKMREGAQAAADELGVTLLTAPFAAQVGDHQERRAERYGAQHLGVAGLLGQEHADEPITRTESPDEVYGGAATHLADAGAQEQTAPSHHGL